MPPRQLAFGNVTMDEGSTSVAASEVLQNNTGPAPTSTCIVIAAQHSCTDEEGTASELGAGLPRPYLERARAQPGGVERRS